MFPKIHLSIERWRKNVEHGVWVSNQGNIKLIKNKKDLEPRIDNSSGYPMVFTERGPIKVHRLVASTWLGEKPDSMCTVDHINSNKRDNSVKNLRWLSSKMNNEYALYMQYSSKEQPVEKVVATVPSKVEIMPVIKVEEKVKPVVEKKTKPVIEKKIEITPPKKKTTVVPRQTEIVLAPATMRADDGVFISLAFLHYRFPEHRIKAFKSLLKEGKIKVGYGNTTFYTYKDFLAAKRTMAPGENKEDNFISGVINSAAHSSKTYCGRKWKIGVR